MSLRISNTLPLAFALSLGAVSCGEETVEPVGEPMACAIGAGAKLSTVCTVERTVSGGVNTFIIHHPDGGFRKFAFGDEGMNTDGAAEVVVNADAASGMLNVSVENDRYRIPLETDPETR